MHEPTHRKPGHVGSFTIHAPEDYQPKHRAEENSEKPLPIFEFMECW
jgi:hypothetical protein